MKKPGTLLPLLALIACAVISVLFVVGPTSVLMPLEVHTPELVARVYRLDAYGQWITLALVALGGWLLTLVWRRGGGPSRAIGVLPMLVLLAAAFFSRQQLVEWMMFEPIETIGFVALAEASHVADEDLVIGLMVDGEARAYPVRMMAYYHIANDRLAGEPYVVTY